MHFESDLGLVEHILALRFMLVQLAGHSLTFFWPNIFLVAKGLLLVGVVLFSLHSESLLWGALTVIWSCSCRRNYHMAASQKGDAEAKPPAPLHLPTVCFLKNKPCFSVQTFGEKMTTWNMGILLYIPPQGRGWVPRPQEWGGEAFGPINPPLSFPGCFYTCVT